MNHRHEEKFSSKEKALLRRRDFLMQAGGGLGSLIYIKRRLQQVPDMFAIILVISLESQRVNFFCYFNPTRCSCSVI